MSQKKVPIGPPKPQFLSETFEIFTIGILFHSGFSTFSDLKKFDFKGPKSMFEIFRNSQKTGCSFFHANFKGGTNAEKKSKSYVSKQKLN